MKTGKKRKNIPEPILPTCTVSMGMVCGWLFKKKAGRMIGRAGLNNIDIHGEPALEMGYMIGKLYQKSGICHRSL